MSDVENAAEQQVATLHSGYYAELWRPNSGQNVYPFFRGSGDNRVVVVINESDLQFGQFGQVGIPLRDNSNIRNPDKEAFREGAILDRLFDQNSAPENLKVLGGKLMVTLPPRLVGVYRLR